MKREKKPAMVAHTVIPAQEDHKFQASLNKLVRPDLIKIIIIIIKKGPEA
jgi:hypothetical protein